MKLTSATISILAAAALTASACISAHAQDQPLRLDRAGRLDTIGIGAPGLKKTPAMERVGIEKKGVEGGSVVSRKDPLVLITEPSESAVDRGVQRVSGSIGSGITKAYVRINDDTRIVPVTGGQFSTSCALKQGINTITALGWDLEGNLGKNSIKVFYRPAATKTEVRIVKPEDGSVVDITEDRVVKVVARANDASVSSGVLVVNNIPWRVSLDGGTLEQELALLPGENEIYIEVTGPDGKTADSRTVRVHTFDARPKDLVSVLTWDTVDTDLDLHIWDSFGHHTFGEARDPYQCESSIPKSMLDIDRKGNYGPEVFSMESAEPEVYTFYAQYMPGIRQDRGADAYLNLLLYGNDPTRRIMRMFGPARLDRDHTVWEAAHVKMPEGVFFQEKDADLVKTLGMDAKAVKRLSLMLKEENPVFGLLAISAMGQIKSEGAVAPLTSALKTGPVEIRRAAAGALWNIKSVEAVDALIGALADPDHEVRRAAAGALGALGDSRAVQPLTVLLSDEGDVGVRLGVIRAIGMLGDVKALETLAAQTADPEQAVRVEAVRALSGIKDNESVVAILMKSLGDGSGRVRELAAWSLGRLHAKKAAKPLMDLLYFDDEEGVRVQAAVALGRLGDTDAITELEKAADKDFSPRVRFCAGKSITGLTPQEPLPGAAPQRPVVVDEDLVVY